MNTCFAYGLKISSELPLPELTVSEGKGEISIRLGKVTKPAGSLLQKEEALGIHFYIESLEAYLFWEDMGAICIAGGEEIIIDPLPGVDQKVIRLYLLGTAFGILLHQRRMLPLHASGVGMDGKGVAFLGESGCGKSTLTAALYARGHVLIADDILAIPAAGEIPEIYPAFPRLKLWQDTASALGYSTESSLRLHPDYEKFNIPVQQNFSQKSLPLCRAYVLSEAEEPSITPLTSQQALFEWTRHIYRLELLPLNQVTACFLQCVEIASKTPLFSLKMPHSFNPLSDLILQLEDDIGIRETALA